MFQRQLLAKLRVSGQRLGCGLFNRDLGEDKLLAIRRLKGGDRPPSGLRDEPVDECQHVTGRVIHAGDGNVLGSSRPRDVAKHGSPLHCRP